MKMKTYFAFLRGINVGGKRLVKMDALRSLFLELGYENAHTILASGNIRFEAVNPTAETIESALESSFGFSIPVTLWTLREIQTLVESNPFSHVDISPDTKCYVTFTADRAVCSLLVLSKDRKTTDLMKELDKEYGKRVTTRNWNTVLRLLK
ncbi:MAG: DUF1697 domain-containing protein [Candidatus Margulisbacteria bacterium]|nr:DUF1697 domain-containing protein [Candidatus Margulisiibacteriota bacterium]